ncbi:MAG: toll/interleukin-1 receptor domain-containing protein [Pseudomonadota bacterium]
MKIFISYRRADALLTARAMKTFLDGIPAISDVFLDFDQIPYGQDFTDVIKSSLSKSNVCIVLIGNKYLTGGEMTGQPRIFDPEDLVRREASLALESKTKVVPVLIDDSKMPGAVSLPEDLKELPKLNAFQLRSSHFNGDMDDLLDVLFGKAKGSGGRWTRPPLTFVGSIKRLIGGAAIGAGLVAAAAIINSILQPHGCFDMICTTQKQFFNDAPTLTEGFNRAREVVVPAVAGVIVLAMLFPFLWRWVRR